MDARKTPIDMYSFEQKFIYLLAYFLLTRLSDVKSSLATITQLHSSRHHLFHPRVSIDLILPAAALASHRHPDDVLLDLREVDDERCGWPERGWLEMTSYELPLFLTPTSFQTSDWKLLCVDLRRSCFNTVQYNDKTCIAP